MRGHIKQRYDGSWSLVIDLGRRIDPETGHLKTGTEVVHGTRDQEAAENKLTELLRIAETGQVIEPSKLTLGQWLDEWHLMASRPTSGSEPMRATNLS